MYRLGISLGLVITGLLQFYWNNVADAIFYIALAIYVQSLRK
jgi:TM2 domain-containing membrane protein YozV